MRSEAAMLYAALQHGFIYIGDERVSGNRHEDRGETAQFQETGEKRHSYRGQDIRNNTRDNLFEAAKSRICVADKKPRV